MNKVFVVGLPRTGTTSFCAAMLEYGFTVAHTAYTQQTFADAQVIADTPVFCDYKKLDKHFPDSRFVLLERNLDEWIASIQVLLGKMQRLMDNPHGGFNPVLRRCYTEVFNVQDNQFNRDAAFLAEIYKSHRENVIEYFQGRDDLLSINVSDKDALKRTAEFLGFTVSDEVFPHLNKSGKITAWKKIKHDNKIQPSRYGINRRRFLDYDES